MALPVSAAGLPAELTSFVGRQHEVDSVVAAVAAARAVTLTGPGGVGKTRIACRVAGRVTRPTADAGAFVRLDAVTDPRLVVPTVAAGLGLRDDGAAWSVADLCSYLGDSRLLLVVDNCEQVVGEVAAVVHALLEGTARVRVLATSRRPLAVPGEVLVEVSPLPVPSSADPEGDLLAYDAVRLLVERATAGGASVEALAGSTAGLVELSQRLEGIPLAIELAAARLRALGLTQLLDRLDDRQTVLGAGPRAVAERQRTVASTLTWSYDLCTAAEQRAWSQLAVFEGGFGIEAAEHVCADDDPGAPSAFDLVAGLVDQSVLAPEDDGSRVRFRMLQTVRAYGLERLAAAGAELAARERHRDWFRAETAAIRRDWFGPGQTDLLDRLDADVANVRAAMRFSEERGELSAALGMATDLWFSWLSRGSVAEGVDWLTRLLGQLPADADAALRVRAAGALGNLAGLAGDESAMAAALATGAAAGQHTDSPTAAAEALLCAGLLAAVRGQLDEAWDLLSRLLADADTAEPLTTAFTLQVIAAVASLRGDHDAAAAAVQRGLELSGRHGEEWCCQYMLIREGEARLGRGDVAGARQSARHSLAMAADLRHRFGALSAVELLVWCAVGGDEPLLAAELLGALESLWPTVGVAPTGPGPERADYRAAVDSLAEVEPTATEAARASGRRLSYDELVARCLGEPVPVRAPRRPPRAGPAGRLTAREAEVAELVARGLSNRQIADTLVVSPRTAEGHVQRVLDKLGYTSRASIAYWVAERRAAATGSPSSAAPTGSVGSGV